MDSGLPNIIDSLLINLDNLQLGADFTEEMTFTGYHNISHMTMSFRVACRTGFCGSDCTATPRNNAQLLSCDTNGTLVCTDSRYNPSENCNSCFYKLDISTSCSTCIEPNFDPDTNCTACLPGFNINISCSTCVNTNYVSSGICLKSMTHDPMTNCTTWLDSNLDADNNCSSCLIEGYDPLIGCTQCLPNRDPSTICSTCLPGWDRDYDCSMCLPGRNSTTNCTTCSPGYSGEGCQLPGNYCMIIRALS